MKKKLILASVIVANLITGCASEDSRMAVDNHSSKSTIHRFEPTQFTYLGEQHNEYLAELKSAFSANAQPLDSLQVFAEGFINHRLTNNYESVEDLNFATEFIHAGLTTVPDYSEVLYPSLSVNDLISDNTKTYLDQLHSILMEDNAELANIVAKIEDLESQAYQDENLTNDDLLIIFPATSVGKYSITYWTDHIDSWESFLNQDTLFSKRKTPGRRVAEIAVADVGGAVGAAAATWAVNVWVGPGQVTYGAAILGGAVATSGAAAVYHIAASIFDWD